jgi:hypothetical protein
MTPALVPLDVFITPKFNESLLSLTKPVSLQSKKVPDWDTPSTDTWGTLAQKMTDIVLNVNPFTLNGLGILK